MSANNPSWIWSEPYQDHYYVTYDGYRRPVYHWYKQTQVMGAQVSAPASDMRPRNDSVYQQDYGSNIAQMPEPATQDVRAMQDFISGTPHTGWYDLLDLSYRMRTGSEAQSFFVVGKVFAMLYSETASETSAQRSNDDAYTVVRFNERAHTNIRRFIVLEVRRGFVYACGIGTYSGRGTLKEGCIPSEHAIVHLSGTDPASCYLPGEYESGMTKEPIEIEPLDSSIWIRRESRIRFGKTYPIEKNVKVKDIGQVHPNHKSKLLQYWTDEDEAE